MIILITLWYSLLVGDTEVNAHDKMSVTCVTDWTYSSEIPLFTNNFTQVNTKGYFHFWSATQNQQMTKRSNRNITLKLTKY